jgi:hypothetical protein
MPCSASREERANIGWRSRRPIEGDDLGARRFHLAADIAAGGPRLEHTHAARIDAIQIGSPVPSQIPRADYRFAARHVEPMVDIAVAESLAPNPGATSRCITEPDRLK